jgi:hypothetical protein
MTDFFVGPGGSNGNSGLTWALRWLDFTNVTVGNFPSGGGNRLIVGPGTYRATLTCQPGASGNRHEYRGDPTGFLTDKEGGVVRITGSDNDVTATRASCITSADNTIVSGFWLDFASTELLGTTFHNSILEDCVFTSPNHLSTASANLTFTNGETATVRRCYFDGYGTSTQVQLRLATDSSPNPRDAAVTVENCIIRGPEQIRTVWLYGADFRANTLVGTTTAINIQNITTEGVSTMTHNVLFARNSTVLVAVAGSSHVEDWNQINGSTTPRQNIATGTNSTIEGRISQNIRFHMLKGILLAPPQPFEPSVLNPDRYSGDTGTGIPATDFFGIARPTAHAKRSLGAIQHHDIRRSTSVVRSGTQSMQLVDAARQQIKIPYAGSGDVTVSVYVRRETDYTGTLPGFVLKQPWRSDTTVTDTGAANTWNLLSTTYTPTAGTNWFIIELYSDNTAAAGSYNVYFDDLSVTTV